jgi:hypothetical protein
LAPETLLLQPNYWIKWALTGAAISTKLASPTSKKSLIFQASKPTQQKGENNEGKKHFISTKGVG